AGELRRILRGIHSGEAHVSPGLAARVLTGLARPDPRSAASPLQDLTAREEEILRHVATGKSNKEIALELGLQEKTVKHHMTTIMSKIHARNRVEAAIKAHEAWKDLPPGS
ncbi:MAG: response regulator transcription factor, partial [Paracoccaceae bacterium]